MVQCVNALTKNCRRVRSVNIKASRYGKLRTQPDIHQVCARESIVVREGRARQK